MRNLPPKIFWKLTVRIETTVVRALGVFACGRCSSTPCTGPRHTLVQQVRTALLKTNAARTCSRMITLACSYAPVEEDGDMNRSHFLSAVTRRDYFEPEATWPPGVL